jgi:hypothetical protein
MCYIYSCRRLVDFQSTERKCRFLEYRTGKFWNKIHRSIEPFVAKKKKKHPTDGAQPQFSKFQLLCLSNANGAD